MIELENARINTAGAYICIEDLYLFAIGIHPHNGYIPVVRIGGHREEHETGWQCAVREVREESNLHMEPVHSRQTYLSDLDHLDADLQEMEWKNKIEHEPDPFLVVSHRREDHIFLSLMYLAHAEGMPRPSAEVKGLLLLCKDEIHRLCQETHTLGDYLARGGRAILNAEFDKSLVLEPFAQLRLLSRILDMYPEFEAEVRSSNSMTPHL
jgi:ADP-ribose pyrophosphatase YjhB (NUDIX family)